MIAKVTPFLNLPASFSFSVFLYPSCSSPLVCWLLFCHKTLFTWWWWMGYLKLTMLSWFHLKEMPKIKMPPCSNPKFPSLHLFQILFELQRLPSLLQKQYILLMSATKFDSLFLFRMAALQNELYLKRYFQLVKKILTHLALHLKVTHKIQRCIFWKFFNFSFSPREIHDLVEDTVQNNYLRVTENWMQIS